MAAGERKPATETGKETSKSKKDMKMPMVLWKIPRGFSQQVPPSGPEGRGECEGGAEKASNVECEKACDGEWRRDLREREGHKAILVGHAFEWTVSGLKL